MIPLFHDLLHDKETFVIFIIFSIGMGIPIFGIWKANSE